MAFKLLAASLALALVSVGSALAADCSLPSDGQAGKIVSNQCKACHEFVAGKPSRATAPNIHDIYGDKAGSRTDFTHYSAGMNGVAAKGLAWTDDNLMEYLADPKAFLDKVNGKPVPHAMFFQLKDEQKRKDIVAFLRAIKGRAECN